MDYSIRRIWIHKDSSAKESWNTFLIGNKIRSEDTTDYTVGVYYNNNLVATGSLFENIIKCIAVDPSHQGGSIFNMLISHLIDEIYERKFNSCYVYTKPEAVSAFIYLGFSEIARVDNQLIFLEKAVNGFSQYLENLRSQKIIGEKISAIVMNANPFTNGHLYLVEYAAERSDVLHIFVLSENLSVFPNDVRLKLVKEGTQHLENVFVHETGDYMVSAKTFPSYFLKEDTDVTTIQAKLDATVFTKIAKVLDISHRYVGEEPYSVATAIYNKAMSEVFKNEIDLTIIPRKEHNGDAISASRVRKLISEGRLYETREMVPPTTFDFFDTAKGKEIEKVLQERSN